MHFDTLEKFLDLIMSPGKTVLSLRFQCLSYRFRCHSCSVYLSLSGIFYFGCNALKVFSSLACPKYRNCAYIDT